MSEIVEYVDTVKRWSELPFKNKISLSLAVGSFSLGWIAIFVGMLVGDNHTIDYSVITVFGMALVFCGSIIGIDYHYQTSVDSFKKEIREYLK